MKADITIWLLIIGLLLPLLVSGQSSNPFELKPLLQKGEAVSSKEKIDSGTGNPFDITAPEGSAYRIPEPIPEIKPMIANGRDRFFLVVTIFQLLLLATLFTLLRDVIFKIFQAFSSDNLFNLLYRERIARGPLSFSLLLSLFFYNGGLFTWHLSNFTGYSTTMDLFSQLGIAIGLITLILLFKYILLGLIGFIFPVEEEMLRYRFLITVFSIVLGLGLIPFNLLLAYGPDSIKNALIYVSLAILVLFYLFRSLRALLIANRKVSIFSFHFFLYICTIEIAPALIFWKLISNKL